MAIGILSTGALIGWAYPAQAVFFRGHILDRRTEERYPVRLPLRARIRLDTGESFVEDCILLNVSALGLYLLLLRELPVQSRVGLELEWKNGSGTNPLWGHVVRIDRLDSDGRYGAAVRLDEPLDLHFAKELQAP